MSVRLELDDDTISDDLGRDNSFGPVFWTSNIF